MRSDVLITGASGFVGHHLSPALRKEHPTSRTFVLCRRDASCASHLGEKGLSTVRYLVGDVSRDNLGLSEPDLAQLQNVAYVWHLAAHTGLDADTRTLSVANVDGTRRMITLASRLPRLARFYHLSTAYVGGVSDRRVPEARLDRPRLFRGAYEASKWLAEEQIYESSLPFVILRPSIVVPGRDWQPARRARMPGVYRWVLAVSRFLERVNGASRLRIVGYQTSQQNLVCVDDLIERFLSIDRFAKERTTHNLVNRESVTLGQITQLIEDTLGQRALRFCGRKVVAPTSLELRLGKLTRSYAPYHVELAPSWDVSHIGGWTETPMTDRLLQELIERLIGSRRTATVCGTE